MATNNKAVKETKAQESVYTIDQLADAYRELNASYAIIKTSLKLSGKTKFTLNEAQKIIETFKNKEVN